MLFRAFQRVEVSSASNDRHEHIQPEQIGQIGDELTSAHRGSKSAAVE